MLSVIIDARAQPEGLAALLAQLTSGAVDGLVRQVMVVATAGPSLVLALCEETGALPCDSLRAAAMAARAEQMMVLPAHLRLREGWLASLNAHVQRGGGPALVLGIKAPGLFGRSAFGVLVERGRLANGREADLYRLRRELGLGAVRIG